MPVLPAAIRVLPRPVHLAIGAVLTHPWFHPVHSRLYRWSGGRGPLSRALGVRTDRPIALFVLEPEQD